MCVFLNAVWALTSGSFHIVSDTLVVIIIIHAFVMRASSLMILNQRHRQSLDGQHGKNVDRLLEKVSFQTAFEGVESG